jgi:hypothetical protein
LRPFLRFAGRIHNPPQKRGRMIIRPYNHRRARPNPTPGETPTLRHSGLDPKSSSSIKFSGALRRKKRFWIPGQARNDEAFLRLQPFLRFAGRVICWRRRARRAVPLQVPPLTKTARRWRCRVLRAGWIRGRCGR